MHKWLLRNSTENYISSEIHITNFFVQNFRKIVVILKNLQKDNNYLTFYWLHKYNMISSKIIQSAISKELLDIMTYLETIHHKSDHIFFNVKRIIGKFQNNLFRFFQS